MTVPLRRESNLGAASANFARPPIADAYDLAALADYDHPAVNLTLEVLQSGLVEEVIHQDPTDLEMTTTLLGSFVRTTVNTVRDSYLLHINSDFPFTHEPDSAIPTERAYVASQNGERRQRMRNIYQQTVGLHKEKLYHSIISDRTIKDVPRKISIDHQAITEQLDYNAEGRRASVEQSLDRIMGLLSGVTTAPQEVSRRIFSILKRKQEVTFTTVYPDELGEELQTFVTLIQNLQTTTLAEETAQHFMTDIGASITEHLEERYDVLTDNWLIRLGEELETAYREQKRTTRQRKLEKSYEEPVSSNQDLIASLARFVTDLESDTNAVQSDEEQIEHLPVTTLGTLQSPFPWNTDENMAVQLVQNGDKRIVVCTALIDETTKMSQQLLEQSRRREDISTIKDRIFRFITTNGNLRDSNSIRRVRFVKFHDMVVHYYAKNGPDTSRVYFVKRPPSDFPEMADFLAEKEIEPDTPLVVFLAIADKNHQERVYESFGVNRRQARVQNVGAV